MIEPAVAVDKYQTVAFDGNRYSVPRPFAFRMVTVKGYVDRVVIVAEGQDVATHAAVDRADDGARSDPLSGGAGPQTRRPRPCPGVPRLEAARMLHRLPRRAGKTPRRGGRRTTVREHLATHGGTSHGPRAKAIEKYWRAFISAEAVIRRTRSFATIAAPTRPASHPHSKWPAGSGPGAAPRPELLRPVPGRSPENHKSSTDEIMPMQCSDPSAEGPVAVFFA